MSLNNEQRDAVYAHGNIVVTAGAGSGKTTVLASRVLFLLVHKRIALKNILVLTFTNKAASEMHERIHKQLLQCIEDKVFLTESLTDEHILFLQEQLKTFDLAHISTIDSFLYKIAQEGSSHFGILGDILISETIDSHARSFIQQYLIEHKNNPMLQQLITLHGIVRLTEEIYSPLLLNTNIFHAASTLELHGEKVLQAIEANIPRCKEKILENLQCMCDTLEYAGVQESSTQNSPSIQKFTQDINAIREIVTESTNAKTVPEHLSHIPLSLKGVTSTKKIKESNVAGTLKKQTADTKSAREQLLTLENTIKHRKWIEQSYKESSALVNAWVAYKKKTMLFSYNDVSHLAQKTVEEVSVVQAYLASFSHIIVDEVQDNSKEQNYLLHSLRNIVQKNDKNPPDFFFVGDPKQSIYKFRGADVQTFIALTENSTMQKHELLHNYRSSCELISFFNEVFTDLFAQKFNENNVYSGIVYTEQQAAGDEKKANTTHRARNSHIEFRMLKLPETDTDETNTNIHKEKNQNPLMHSKSELEAFSIAKIVQEIIQSGDYKAQDIAVLARSSTLFPYLQKIFLMLNIPYEIQTKEESLRQDLGYDFYAWCTLLLTPEDIAAYVSVLRGPLANVSDDTVIQILAQRKNNKNNFDETYLFTITEDAALKHDIARLAIMKKLYREARKFIEENNLQKLLIHFWFACGYRYVILRNPHMHPFLKQYHVLKSLITSSASKDIGSFIDFLRAILQETSENGFESTRILSEQTEAAVQIMTIHRSKGLEFPVVIFADTSRNLRKNHKSRYAKINTLTYVDFGLPHDSVYALRDGSDNKAQDNAIERTITQHEKSDLYEELRVLYVACTRAQNRLYISGVAPEKPFEAHQEIKTHYDMFCSVLDTKYTQENNVDIYKIDSSLREAEKKNNSTSMTDEEYTQKIEKILQSSVQMQWQETPQKCIKTISPSAEAESHSETQKKLDQEKLPTLSVDSLLDMHNLHKEFGILCHEILKHACLGHKKRYHRLPATLETCFLTLKENEYELLITCAEQCAQRFLESPLWKEKQNDAHIFTEYKIIHCDDTKCIWMPMVVDLIILEKNQCIIVDYKTDLHKNRDKYALQVQAYASAVEQFLLTRIKNNARITVTPYVFYLRSSEAQEITRTMSKEDIFNAYANI